MIDETKAPPITNRIDRLKCVCYVWVCLVGLGIGYRPLLLHIAPYGWRTSCLSFWKCHFVEFNTHLNPYSSWLFHSILHTSFSSDITTLERKLTMQLVFYTYEKQKIKLRERENVISPLSSYIHSANVKFVLPSFIFVLVSSPHSLH